MYCPHCVSDNFDTALTCVQCGASLVGNSTSKDKPPPSPVRLWSPDKAALFSLVFSASFGAVIHALNWHTLGQRSKALVSWVWAVVIFITFNAVAVHGYAQMRDNEEVNKTLQLVQFVTLVLWYFFSARQQSRYVVTHFPSGYSRKSWFPPLYFSLVLLGISLWLVT